MAQKNQPQRPPVRALIERGLGHHQAGRLQDAKVIYEQAVKLNPGDPDALHLCGVVALQTGDPGKAVELIRLAIQAQRQNPAFHGNLGQALLALNRAADAHAEFQRAARLDPRNPQFAVGVATCLAGLGKVAQAEQALRLVTQRHPDYALAWFNLGNATREQQRPAEAVDCYRRCIALDPAFAEAHNNLGSVLHALERFDEAEHAYRQFLALLPDAAPGWCNLASLLIDRGRFADAEAVCRRALERAPAPADRAELHLMLCGALEQQGKLAATLEAAGAAVALAPASARAAWVYGGALIETGHEADGLAWLARAGELQPDASEFRDAMAGFNLAAGKLREGWRQYGSRPARRRFVEKFPDLALVKKVPGNLSGRKILLLREQGLGDELFFLRFAVPLKSRGASITYRADAKIASMLERVPALERILSENDPPPTADFNLLLGDLPHALDGWDFPQPLALVPLPARLESTKQRLAALGPPPYLGLTWRAGTAPERQRGSIWVLHKAVALEPLAAALRDVNGTLLALQRHPEAGEIAQLAQIAGRPVHDLTALNEDLEAMLALLALLDDYIGVSNTNMHLRAGTGRSARVLMPRPAEWRWMTAGDASPWFPDFRIYRQDTAGNWGRAFDRLAADLQARFGASE